MGYLHTNYPLKTNRIYPPIMITSGRLNAGQSVGADVSSAAAAGGPQRREPNKWRDGDVTCVPLKKRKVGWLAWNVFFTRFNYDH